MYKFIDKLASESVVRLAAMGVQYKANVVLFRGLCMLKKLCYISMETDIRSVVHDLC